MARRSSVSSTGCLMWLFPPVAAGILGLASSKYFIDLLTVDTCQVGDEDLSCDRAIVLRRGAIVRSHGCVMIV